MSGVVKVTIHTNTFITAPGSFFMVPRGLSCTHLVVTKLMRVGNDYQIDNASDEIEARLVFAQARKMRAKEDDPELSAKERANPADPLGKNLPERKKGLGRVQEEEEGEEEEGGDESGSEEEPVGQRKSVAKRKR